MITTDQELLGVVRDLLREPMSTLAYKLWPDLHTNMAAQSLLDKKTVQLKLIVIRKFLIVIRKLNN